MNTIEQQHSVEQQNGKFNETEWKRDRAERAARLGVLREAERDALTLEHQGMHSGERATLGDVLEHHLSFGHTSNRRSGIALGTLQSIANALNMLALALDDEREGASTLAPDVIAEYIYDLEQRARLALELDHRIEAANK